MNICFYPILNAFSGGLVGIKSGFYFQQSRANVFSTGGATSEAFSKMGKESHVPPYLT